MIRKKLRHKKFAVIRDYKMEEMCFTTLLAKDSLECLDSGFYL